jgi:hypothetical protein
MVALELGSQDFLIVNGNLSRAVGRKPPLLQLVADVLLYPRGLLWGLRMGENQVLMAPVGGQWGSRSWLLGSGSCRCGKAPCSQQHTQPKRSRDYGFHIELPKCPYCETVPKLIAAG